MTARLFNTEIVEQKKEIMEIEKWYKDGKISLAQRDAEKADVENEINLLIRTLQSHTGELPLSPLRKKRLTIATSVV